MSRMMKTAALAILFGAGAAHAAAIKVNGSFTSYTTVVGAADPYVLGLPEAFSIVLNTNGNSIVDGTITFTGNSGKQFPLTGGTISVGATTDFIGTTLPTSAGGAIGGTLSLSFNTTIPNTTQAGLDSLIGKQGANSLFGFPFNNGSQGFYTGNVTAVAVPEPVTLGALGLALPLLRRRRH